MATRPPASSRVVVEAPFSFTGSAKRLWKPVANVANPVAKIALGFLMVTVIFMAWTMILCWYLMFGLLLVPYRLLRRGSRNRKRQDLQHREQLAAVERARRP